MAFTSYNNLLTFFRRNIFADNVATLNSISYWYSRKWELDLYSSTYTLVPVYVIKAEYNFFVQRCFLFWYNYKLVYIV